MNGNSSRFGKYVELFFSEDGYLQGGRQSGFTLHLFYYLKYINIYFTQMEWSNLLFNIYFTQMEWSNILFNSP